VYISDSALIYALKELEALHPFFGITFLVCKKDKLRVGQTFEYAINTRETDFLNQYYKPEKRTEKFFRVFRTSEKNKFWLNSDYASSGSQATRTQMFGDAFIHLKNSNLWGWSENYLSELENHLSKRKIPAYCLALWIMKDEIWPNNVTIDLVLKTFLDEFNIGESEIASLFDLTSPPNIDFFYDYPYNWSKISDVLEIPPPPDLPVEKGGALISLEVNGMDTSKDFQLELGSRLNIITGDNGLGKSFLLETAWWSLTQHWTGYPILPSLENAKKKPTIKFTISNSAGKGETFSAEFDWKTQNWEIRKKDQKTLPGLVIYARVDGAFAIWDPSRIQIEGKPSLHNLPSTLVFSREDVWDGVRVDEKNRERSIFNGLITDWVHWQNSNDEAFDILKKILTRLSPPDLQHGDLGTLEPGKIVRIPGESRPMPTIKHPYGEVPIIFASAAVKRIIALAYLIVWTWEEHKTSSKQMRERPQTKMVVIADEIESHLHPQWQRVILPSLTSISEDLSNELTVQFLLTTHSPLIMASLEPFFDESIDRIFHLNLVHNQKGTDVVLETPKFEKRGSADSWLVSDIFELRQPRSVEAETMIERAKALQKLDKPNKDEIKDITDQLLKLLPPHDTFWIRWNYFAEKHGVQA
jgi:hypothetical protein